MARLQGRDSEGLLSLSHGLVHDVFASDTDRDGEVTFEKELSYSSSYFQVRNLGTLVTSVTVTTV